MSAGTCAPRTSEQRWQSSCTCGCLRRTHPAGWAGGSCIHTRLCTYTHTHAHAHTHTCTYRRTHTQTHLRTHMDMYTHITHCAIPTHVDMPRFSSSRSQLSSTLSYLFQAHPSVLQHLAPALIRLYVDVEVSSSPCAHLSVYCTRSLEQLLFTEEEESGTGAAGTLLLWSTAHSGVHTKARESGHCSQEASAKEVHCTAVPLGHS